jgi:hypothetical protein
MNLNERANEIYEDFVGYPSNYSIVRNGLHIPVILTPYSGLN